ncbi:hypothetical protein EXM22_11185 [Oceanispirochaeta crateris]|uniref:Uncharacterized protein n=1 Tax=Oceanispirochaeta crateris TaxID=2518645 RepID=A0A5C1QLK9_9SPIO|nr:hypothetical protein [Oceanispirochaeta crateris]QEN08521.1 hypothetical protein EXM22_11185 [Oceanispirochaeta crateris]
MISKKNMFFEVLPEYTCMISESSNPVFKTCEVLTRIDNLFLEDVRPLGNKDKILLLKELRKKLEMSLSEIYLINRSQDDSNRNVLELIDKKIEQYSHKKVDTPLFPKIYERKSWWR